MIINKHGKAPLPIADNPGRCDSPAAVVWDEECRECGYYTFAGARSGGGPFGFQLGRGKERDYKAQKPILLLPPQNSSQSAWALTNPPKQLYTLDPELRLDLTPRQQKMSAIPILPDEGGLTLSLTGRFGNSKNLSLAAPRALNKPQVLSPAALGCDEEL
ncbi:hypothetical protein B9Z19DRAFT_1063544 [Tuber borchii]|uniref:Uncharacterized protein n=1 Tax=Tuber borchii TaxID=42251 RepID=A0A2T6ZXR6_TUBBO|nr:hypothetical protein B9Z19DRAFT_1063544 [Tuber borchii]